MKSSPAKQSSTFGEKTNIALSAPAAESFGAAVPPQYIPVRLAICLLAFTFLFFFNTINQYFLLDDFEVIYSAKYNRLGGVLFGHDTVLEFKFFRPIPMFFTWLLHRIFDTAPAAFHALSVFLHGATAVAAANLVYLIHRDMKLAALFGVVFIVFPNHAEVVNWPAITFTSWAALFFLLSLNVYAYFRLSGRWYLLILSLLAFLAAILSKEDAFTLPAVLVLFDFFFSRARRLKYSLLRQGATSLLYFFLLLAVIQLTRVNMGLGAGYLTVEGEDLVSLYLHNFSILLSDLVKMNLLAWRNLLAPVSPEIPFSNYLSLSVFALLGASLVMLIWKKRISWRELIFCFVFVSITALPILGTFRVLKITHWVRFLYLPSIGGCYIVSLALSGILSSCKKKSVKYAIAALALSPVMLLAKYYDHQWIGAQRENRQIMEQVSGELDKLPRHSRLYVAGVPWSKAEIPRIDYALPAAVALYYDLDTAQGGLHFLPANKVLALGREKFSDAHWFSYHMDLNAKNAVPRDITPKPSYSEFLETWDFSKYRLQSFLNPVNGMVFLSADQSFPWPLLKIGNQWSLLWLTPVNPARPVKYLKIEMMMIGKSAGVDICRLFWVSEDDPEISGGKSIGFFAIADGEFHEYRIPLYRNGLTLIHPRLVRFALRPSQKLGTIFSIKSITTEYY